jgi:prepilin-type N-terminal cleavage/methylation domain
LNLLKVFINQSIIFSHKEVKMKSIKGFTLIELIIYLSISSIIILSATKIFLIIVNDYKKEVYENRQDDYVNEAFRYIETEIDNGTRKVYVMDNSIFIQKYTAIPDGSVDINFSRLDLVNSNTNNISVVGNNLMVKYIGRSDSPNNILRNVGYFNVSIEEKNLKISIKLIGGKRFEKCISLRFLDS